MSAPALDLAVITGMSGSGKSVALHALEDAGYYCVDNLPPELLAPLAALMPGQGVRRLAVAVDVRAGQSLPQLPLLLHSLREQVQALHLIFLDASDAALVQRFSETRRPHPLSLGGDSGNREALAGAIARERDMLADLRERAHRIDTSHLRTAQLMAWVKELVAAPRAQLTLVFESFAFKRGLSLDADYVFDVRMLPNPHYETELRPLTGLDAPVAQWLAAQPEVQRMQRHLTNFLRTWLPALESTQRSYVTVAIGCTGGQHRSVWLAEQLAHTFSRDWPTLRRHRELIGGKPRA